MGLQDEIFKLNIKIGLVKVERSIKWGGREKRKINTRAKLIEGRKCRQETGRSVCFGSKFELDLFWVMVMYDIHKRQEKKTRYMFEPRVKLGHNMFSLSDEMVNNSSFVLMYSHFGPNDCQMLFVAILKPDTKGTFHLGKISGWKFQKHS